MDDPKPIRLYQRIRAELLDLHGESEACEYILVKADQADYKAGLIGENTPLGRALLGRSAGQTIAYAVGDLRSIRILAVEPLAAGVDDQVAEQRRAAVRRAEAQSEITSQMIFATAHGSKWGEYDVDLERYLDQDE